MDEIKPLIENSTLSESQQQLRRSINLEELRQSTVQQYPDHDLDAMIDDMQQASNVEHRYQKNRKLSHTRGIKLPIIKLGENELPRPNSLGEVQREHSPPIAQSPVNYTLRHDNLLKTDLDRSTHSDSFNVIPNGEENVVDIRIFFSNGNAVQLQVEDGVEATASDLLQLMAEHMSIDEDVFSESVALWLISPLFELQLKPYHLVYELFTKWPLFLRRFTTANEEEIAEDEPLLVIKRNVNLTIPVEMMHQNESESLTEIFYYDAKDEFMSGRYIVDVATCVKVSALQLAIENGPLLRGENSFEVVHQKLSEIVPGYLLNRVKSFHLFGLIECKSGLEKQIIKHYQEVSNKYSNNHERRMAYLDILRELPFYGASFFNATTDKKQPTSLRLFAGGQQIELLIGINCEYLTVIDKQKNELLLTRCISDCTWFRSTKETNYDEDIPSLFIHFPDDKVLSQLDGINAPTDGDQNEKSPHLLSRLLQLFSKQASLIESLLNFFNEQNGSELGEDLDSPASLTNCEINSPHPSNYATSSSKSTTSKSSRVSSDVPSPSSSLQCCSKINKLCTATLDESGKCIEASGSLRILLECN